MFFSSHCFVLISVTLCVLIMSCAQVDLAFALICLVVVYLIVEDRLPIQTCELVNAD